MPSYLDPKSGAVLPLDVAKASPAGKLFFDVKTGSLIALAAALASPAGLVYYDPGAGGLSNAGTTFGGGGGGGTLLTAPAPVVNGWAGAPGVFFNALTNTYSTNYDFSVPKADWAIAYPGYVTIYVSLSTGNNNNDGLTPGTAVRSLNVAFLLGEANAATAYEINVEASTTVGATQYLRSNTQARNVTLLIPNATYGDALYDAVITKPHRVVPSVANGRFDSFINTSTAITFSPTSDPAVWTANAAVIRLIDQRNRSPVGAPQRLVPLVIAASTDGPDAIAKFKAAWTSLQSVVINRLGQTMAFGCQWTDPRDSTRYVALFDGANPNSVYGSGLRNTTAVTSHQIRPTSAIKMVWEGANLAGGAQGALSIVMAAAAGTAHARFDGLSCSFVAGDYAGVFGTDVNSVGGDPNGGVESYLKNCEASYGALDGFNYHAKNLSFEDGCYGMWNGQTADGLNGANNGSTSHEIGQVIRVNCNYPMSQDRSVHDVGQTVAWMLGCGASSRRTDVSSPGGTADVTSAAFICAHPNGSSTQWWMDGCAPLPNPFGAQRYTYGAYANGVINYIRQTMPTNPFTGTFQPFTYAT